MSYRPIKAQQPTSVLQNSASLQRLVTRAKAVEHLQRLLNQFLQPAAHEHCYLANYHAGILTLIVTDGQWATRLRYQQKRLLKRIQLKVRPPLQTEKPKPRTIMLSEQAGQTIQASAEATQDPRLRKALERLAKHAQKN